MAGLSQHFASFDLRNSLQYRYRQHLAYLKATVPPAQLLLWNVKDGWEPLCTFLEKKVPKKPFPHENASSEETGQKHKFLEEKVFQHGVVEEGKQYFYFYTFISLSSYSRNSI